jgi:hypothetical protein
MYLAVSEIRRRSVELNGELEMLFNAKALVGKPGARQWRFFRACTRELISGEIDHAFKALAPVQAAQWKYEVENKLSRYYLRPGKPCHFIFTMVHVSRLAQYGLEATEQYPNLAGYCVLVRDFAGDSKTGDINCTKEIGSYLERVVAEAVDAEFRAYSALPMTTNNDLLQWFCAQSPAINEIHNIVTRHRQKGWVISNPMNPSTKRVLKIRVAKVESNEAVVRTMEYWYLRWWDMNRNCYVYPYRETNRQVYILRKGPDGWKVYQNLRPSPRTTTPHRRI